MTPQAAENLAALNASLNAASALLAGTGLLLIRRARWRGHAAAMLGAVGASGAFLVSYLYLHANRGYVTRFPDLGWLRTLYLLILISHTVLAALVPPLVLATVFLAVRRRWEAHRKLARWTWPVWLYVSITGVTIYAMLYHLAPRLIGG